MAATSEIIDQRRIGRRIGEQLLRDAFVPLWGRAGASCTIAGLCMAVLATAVRSKTVGMSAAALILMGAASYVLFLIGLLRYWWRARRLRAATVAAHRHLRDGDPERAMQASRAVIERLPRQLTAWVFVNHAVTVFINGGRYEEALELPARWPERARASGAMLDPNAWALTEINLAEAEYNRGRLDAALARTRSVLERVEQRSHPFVERAPAPLIRAGAATQEAWIQALRGEPEEALRILEHVDPNDVPAEYRAEIAYTKAFALNRAGRSDKAWHEAERGFLLAVRPSSRRNGLFLRATIRAAMGEFDNALALFEEGVAHAYKAQGGDALIAWSETLEALGRTADARTALRLCLERDPESLASVVARQRLDGLARQCAVRAHLEPPTEGE